MDGAGPSSSADATTAQKRVQPQRKKRGGIMGNETDQTIIEAQKWRAEKPLLAPEQRMHLTTDSSFAETAVDMGRIVKNFKSEQYYTRPEVIELYRQQRNIATPEVVSLRDEPSLSRFRPREADKTIVSTAQSDEAYQKRHKALETRERRERLRELETMKTDYNKLKERIKVLEKLEFSAFNNLPPESFSPPPVPVDLSSPYSEEAQIEGERRREEMLEAARSLDERYQFLLGDELKPQKKATKAGGRRPATPAKAVPMDEDVDVEVMEDDAGRRQRQEEGEAIQPPSLPTAAPKPKNKGGRPRLTSTLAVDSAQSSTLNAVASTSARRPGKPPRQPIAPATTMGKGKKRAASPAFTQPASKRTPTPPPSPTLSTHEMSVDMTESNGVSMIISDVRTPMPPSPMPPRPPMPATFPAPTAPHRIIPVHQVSPAAPSPVPVQPERLPVVQGAAIEEELDSRPRKRLRSTKTPSEPQASPPPSPRPVPQRKPPVPATSSNRRRLRAPSLPPIASLSSAELAGEEILAPIHKPAAKRTRKTMPVREPTPEAEPVPESEPVEPTPEPTVEEPEPEPALEEPESEPILEEAESEPTLEEAEPEPMLEEEEPEPMLEEEEPEPMLEEEPKPILEEPESMLEEKPEPILEEPELEPILEESEPEPILEEPEPVPLPTLEEVTPAPEPVVESTSDTTEPMDELALEPTPPPPSKLEASASPEPLPEASPELGLEQEAPESRFQSEVPTSRAASPSVKDTEHTPSLHGSSPTPETQSPSPEVPVAGTAGGRGRGHNRGRGRGRGGRGRGGRISAPPAPKGKGRKAPEATIVQAARRNAGQRAHRRTHAFGVKLPSILLSQDEYEYELPDYIVGMAGFEPDGSPDEDESAESEKSRKDIPDLLHWIHSSVVSNLTTRNATPEGHTTAHSPSPPPRDPDSDNL